MTPSAQPSILSIFIHLSALIKGYYEDLYHRNNYKKSLVQIRCCKQYAVQLVVPRERLSEKTHIRATSSQGLHSGTHIFKPWISSWLGYLISALHKSKVFINSQGWGWTSIFLWQVRVGCLMVLCLCWATTWHRQNSIWVLSPLNVPPCTIHLIITCWPCFRSLLFLKLSCSQCRTASCVRQECRTAVDAVMMVHLLSL